MRRRNFFASLLACAIAPADLCRPLGLSTYMVTLEEIGRGTVETGFANPGEPRVLTDEILNEAYQTLKKGSREPYRFPPVHPSWARYLKRRGIV